MTMTDTQAKTHKTKILAHRGASTIAPENTLPAFSAAASLGVDGIELDVQRTADDVLVICHDERIDRTSNGSGFIHEMTFEELRGYDFCNDFEGYRGLKIPTLSEVLELLDDTDLMLNIELKNSIIRYEGMEDQLVETIARNGWTDRVLYSSFNHESMQQMAQDGQPVGLLYDTLLLNSAQQAQDLGAIALHPSGRGALVEPLMIKRAHRKGIQVNIWTLDTARQIKAAIRLGADAVITNEPKLALAARRKVEESAPVSAIIFDILPDVLLP